MVITHPENLLTNKMYSVSYRASKGQMEKFQGKFLNMFSDGGLLWINWLVCDWSGPTRKLPLDWYSVDHVVCR